MEYMGFIVYKYELEKMKQDDPRLYSTLENLIVPYEYKSQAIIGVPITKEDKVDYDAATDLMYIWTRARNNMYFKRHKFIQSYIPEEGEKNND